MTHLPRTLLPLAIAAALLWAGPAGAASFDCAQARAPDERLICSDSALGRADEAMAEAFRRLQGTVGNDEASRARIRGEQRAWIARRNRACGLASRSAPPPDRDAAIECLTAELERRTRQLASLALHPRPGVLARTVSADDRKPGQRYVIRAEYPAIEDASVTGAATFNEAVRSLVGGQVKEFRSDAVELPAPFEPELTLTYGLYAPAPGVLSVQFAYDGVLGNGFRDAAAVTVDLGRGRVLAAGDLFVDGGWVKAAAGLCRKARAAASEPPDICDEGEIGDLRRWRFEPDRMVVTLLGPGKELAEFPFPYRQFAAHLRPDSPVGRTP